MTTNTNIFADAITENRYIASAQLIPADFSRKEWKEYRQLCKVMVDESMKVYKGKDHANFDLALVGLFAMFGMSDANKSIDSYRVRIAVACLKNVKEKSNAYKDASKALTKAKNLRDDCKDAITDTMTEETHPAEFKALADAEAKVEECQNTLDTLASEPHNVWWNTKALKSKNDKELAIARKHIEDTIADILIERSAMTERDKAIEQGRLAGGRKAGKEYDKAHADAQ